MEPVKQSIFKKPWIQSLIGLVVIILISVLVLFYRTVSTQISIEDSIVSAPVILIGPASEGVLEEMYVRAGDSVMAGQALARVGAEVLSAKVDGVVIEVMNTPGQIFQPAGAVIKMIDPKEFRIVGTIDETKGLSEIKIGNPAYFTVDAFPGKKYIGVVDSISPTSRESGVVFSISDKREVKRFDIGVKYDIEAYPELKNGMSAKLKIFKK